MWFGKGSSPCALERLCLLENCLEKLEICVPFCTGAVGEAGEGGGDTPEQVLQPVEEAEREGDPAGNQWQGKGEYKS